MSLRFSRIALLTFGAVAFSACSPATSPPAAIGASAGASSVDEGTATGMKSERKGIRGCIVDGRGQPVALARITASGIGDGAPRVPEMARLSDEEGCYEWPLPPGRYRISVFADGFLASTAEVELSADAAPPAVDFKLEPGVSADDTDD